MQSEQSKIREHFFSNAFSADDLFDGLRTETRGAMFDIIRHKKLSANETICAPGQIPCCLYILREGTAQILHQSGVYEVEKNEILGLTEAVTGQPYAFGVRTSAACRIECISRDDFLAFLLREPDICFRLAQMLGANLQRIYRFLR